MTTQKNWVKVYSTGVEYLAELLKQVLFDNGIEAVVVDKKDNAYLFGWIEVYVSDDDYENSVKIVEDFEKNTSIK
ncbi:MAG: DUF2007 domain-containing protein [Bacteroidales bacterium]|nr:DUF2007 domain-containing protein [Bacteroidales bacterium]HOY37826.1 DUF2007 domain-containing protein [Bacteroidales bacterium]HQP04206.1 DUF2007 domain-containing protein [Bacteroidales bacterium]